MMFSGRKGLEDAGLASSLPRVLKGMAFGIVVAVTLLSTPASAQDVPPGAVPVTAPPEVTAENDYGKELRTVEEEVNGLKERVFRSKATLQLLKELVVEGANAGARVVVWHVNMLPRSYAMESVQYFLDGKNVFTKVDPGGQLAAVKEMKVHEQSVPAGTHNLQVKMTLRGSGYGIFSYLRTYQFTVQSSYALKVTEGRSSVLQVIADSRGGLRNFEERPTVRYEERSDSLQEE